MPGYQLIEIASMQPHKRKGIVPNANELGIIDFLRELEEEPFPLPKFSKWHLVGLEEVLFAARPNEGDLAIEIHRRLNAAAGELEANLLDVQIAFAGNIVRGADMTVKYRDSDLPIGLIFNHPPQEHDGNGNVFYRMEFHLSSP